MASTRAVSTALVGSEVFSEPFATGSIAVSTRRSVALRLASLVCAALARALAGVLPAVVLPFAAGLAVAAFAATVLAAEDFAATADLATADSATVDFAVLASVAPLRAAADFDAPERAALALAAVLAAARVRAAAVFVFVSALLPVVLEALVLERLVLETLALAADFPAAAARAFPDFAALVVAAEALEAALPAAFALAVFLVRASAEAPVARVVLPSTPRRAPATDALRFFAVFLLDEGIRGYSFYCPAVETGREAS